MMKRSAERSARGRCASRIGGGRRTRRKVSVPGPLGLGPAGRALAATLIGWSLAWKGASLWRASKDDNKPWFVALLLANTVGILDAVYLYGVSGARRREKYEEESILSATGEPEQLGHPQET